MYRLPNEDSYFLKVFQDGLGVNWISSSLRTVMTGGRMPFANKLCSNFP